MKVLLAVVVAVVPVLGTGVGVARLAHVRLSVLAMSFRVNRKQIQVVGPCINTLLARANLLSRYPGPCAGVAHAQEPSAALHPLRRPAAPHRHGSLAAVNRPVTEGTYATVDRFTAAHFPCSDGTSFARDLRWLRETRGRSSTRRYSDANRIDQPGFFRRGGYSEAVYR